MNIEQSLSAKLKRLENLSNEQLVKECNQKPDFKNDDEMHEIGKRIDAGTLKVVMKVNTLHIIQ